MKEIIWEIVDKLFDNIPFSKKNELLKEELNLKMEESYNEETQNNSEIKSLSAILAKCDTVENACENFNCEYDEESINNENPSDNKVFNRGVRTLKKYYILKSLFLAVIIDNLISLICNFGIKNIIGTSIVCVIDFLIIVFIDKKYKKQYEKIKLEEKKYNSSGKKAIYDFYDKYSKNLINVVMVDIALIAYAISFAILAVILSNYTIKELATQLTYMGVLIWFVIFLTLKYSYYYQNVGKIYFTDSKNNKFKNYIKKIIKISGIYFTISLILIVLLRNIFSNILNLFIVFAVIYFVICLALNLTLRRAVMFHNLKYNIKKIVITSLLIIGVLGYNFMNMDLFLTQPFINSVSNQLEKTDDISYDEETGVYTITTEKENFKVLQLTDIHLGGSVFSYNKDIKALKACLKLITSTKPDFIVVTGDLVFPMGIMSLSLNNNAPIMAFASFMRNTGIPWAFTYGNHDTESMSKLNKNDFDELMKSLSYKTSHNLLYPYIQPDIYGRSNQRIEIKSKDGNIIQELFLIDSNDYIPESKKINEYDYIRDDQVDWYKKSLLDIEKKEGYMPKSMMFYHIPIRDYKYANDLYEKGSDEVKYYYGILGETMIDKICTSKYDTKLFEEAVKLGSTQAMFFGHDHYNNQSLEYKGIRMTYGYSIDYLAMPGIEEKTDQRGGTLITIKKDGDYEIKPFILKDLE